MPGKRCIIVGGGDFEPSLLPAIGEGDLLVAADSGYAALEKMDIRPHICIGDFDSLSYEPKNCDVLRLPVEKDDTDMVAAARLGMERGYTDFVFLGVLGGERFSHSIAAVQTLGWLLKQGARGVILDRFCRVSAVDDRIAWPASACGSVSVFALGGETEVSMEGLKYSLCHHRLDIFPLGVSNSFVGLPAYIAVHKGMILVVEEPEH